MEEPVPSNCPSVKAARAAASARATTPNFDHEPTGQVTHTIYLYEDEQQARKIYAGLVTPATRKCLGSGVRKRIATEAEDVDVGGVRTRGPKIDRVGDATSGAPVTLGDLYHGGALPAQRGPHLRARGPRPVVPRARRRDRLLRQAAA